MLSLVPFFSSGQYIMCGRRYFFLRQIGVRCVFSLWESLGLGLGLGLNQDPLKKKPQSVPQKKITRAGGVSLSLISINFPFCFDVCSFSFLINFLLLLDSPPFSFPIKCAPNLKQLIRSKFFFNVGTPPPPPHTHTHHHHTHTHTHFERRSGAPYYVTPPNWLLTDINYVGPFGQCNPLVGL